MADSGTERLATADEVPSEPLPDRPTAHSRGEARTTGRGDKILPFSPIPPHATVNDAAAVRSDGPHPPLPLDDAAERCKRGSGAARSRHCSPPDHQPNPEARDAGIPADRAFLDTDDQEPQE